MRVHELTAIEGEEVLTRAGLGRLAAKVGSDEPDAVVLYRISIDRLTGRRASRDRGSR